MIDGAPQSGTQRLFFALWPDAAVRRSLAAVAVQAARDCGGRPMQSRNLHLTLAFLGATDAAQQAAAIAAAATLRMAPCTLGIDRCGYFRQGRERGIVWAGCEAPPQLGALAAELRAALTAASVPFDRKAFVPHVTLLRDARAPQAPLAIAPIAWTVHDFVLVASTRDAQGPLYRIVAGPFGGAGDDGANTVNPVT